MLPRLTLALAIALSAVLSAPLAFAQKAPKKPNQQNPAKPAAVQNAAIQFEEAQALRQALLVLWSADADYNGHRWAAMRALMPALKNLDDSVLKHGTAQMKAATRQGQAQLAQAQKIRRAEGAVPEIQRLSDAQLKQAAQLLGQLRGTLAAHNQSGILRQVDQAIKEIEIALAIR